MPPSKLRGVLAERRLSDNRADYHYGEDDIPVGCQPILESCWVTEPGGRPTAAQLAERFAKVSLRSIDYMPPVQSSLHVCDRCARLKKMVPFAVHFLPGLHSH